MRNEQIRKLEIRKLEIRKLEISKLEISKLEIGKLEIGKLEIAKVRANRPFLENRLLLLLNFLGSFFRISRFFSIPFFGSFGSPFELIVAVQIRLRISLLSKYIIYFLKTDLFSE